MVLAEGGGLRDGGLLRGGLGLPGRHIHRGSLLAVHLGAPILEPDLHLAVRHAELKGELFAEVVARGGDPLKGFKEDLELFFSGALPPLLSAFEGAVHAVAPEAEPWDNFVVHFFLFLVWVLLFLAHLALQGQVHSRSLVWPLSLLLRLHVGREGAGGRRLDGRLQGAPPLLHPHGHKGLLRLLRLLLLLVLLGHG